MASRALLALFLSTAGATAQVVSPHPAFAAQEGDLSTPYLFTAASRLQQIHEDLNGTPMLFNGISFRRDGSLNGAPHGAVAPKTVALTIEMAPAVPCALASSTFAANALTPPTQVFFGTVSTPASWQVPARESPAPFDLRIPIVPWAYSGSGAFLWDATSAAVSSSDRVTLDAAQPSFPLFAWCSYTMHGQGCATATGTMEVRGTGQTLGAPMLAYTVKVTATGAPASSPAAWIVGFQPANAPLPGLCANVWPQPVGSAVGTTDATGRWETWFQVSANPAWLGVGLEMQVAAPDASQVGLPVAVSNGLTYFVQPLGPAFTACSVQSATQGSATGTLLQRAAIVRFD